MQETNLTAIERGRAGQQSIADPPWEGIPFYYPFWGLQRCFKLHNLWRTLGKVSLLIILVLEICRYCCVPFIRWEFRVKHCEGCAILADPTWSEVMRP